MLNFSCSELPKIAKAGASDHSLYVGMKGKEKFSAALEAQQDPSELMLQGCIKVKSQRKVHLLDQNYHCVSMLFKQYQYNN